jgi:hypothetical protein
VVVEDQGAGIDGQPVELGEEVAGSITSPDSPAPDFVQWTRLDDRNEAEKGLESGGYYAAIVIPEVYSQRLASLSGPPAAVPPSGQPPAPEPAGIELLTSPAVRPSTTTLIEDAFTGIVGGVSGATGERLSSAAGEQGAQLTPEVAAVIGDPVRAYVTEAQPVGPDSGNGQSPFFLAFLVNLSGLIGGATIFFLVGGSADRLETRGLRLSRTGLWTIRLLLGFVFGALVAGAELLVAFGLLGVEHEASTAQVYLFLALATTAAACVTMLFAVAFGAAGIGISAVLNVILGLVSSGGLAPLVALPPFYQAYADWLPLRYVVDGLRSLLFYDGSLDAVRLEGGWRDSLWFFGGGGRSEAAGLEDAVWMIGAYLAGAAMLGYLISLLRDLFARRKKPEAGHTEEPVSPGH